MPDKKNKLYSFRTDDKVSPVYAVNNKILMFFNRLGLLDSEKAENIEELETLKEQKGKLEYISAAERGAVDRIKNHKYVKRPVRDGYLYVIEERNVPVISEYEIIGGTLIPIVEEIKSVKDNVRESVSSSPENKFVYVSIEYKTLFAYSSIQWSADYINKCLSNQNNLKDRFQVFDPNTQDYSQMPYTRHKGIQIVCPPKTIEEKEKFDNLDSKFKKTPRFRELMALYNLTIEYEMMDRLDNTTIFFHYTLHDPLGCANDICESLTDQYEYHLALTSGLPIGKSPEEMRPHLENPNYIDWADEKNQQYYALYTSTDIIYRMINGHWASKKQYSDDVNNDILKKVLGIKERKDSFGKIEVYREDLGNLMSLNYYQNALLDFYYNITERIIDGQNVCLTHHNCLSIKPSMIDPVSSFMDDNWNEYIHKSFYYGDDQPLKNPKFLKNGDNLQYVGRELLNIPHGEYIRSNSKNELLSNIGNSIKTQLMAQNKVQTIKKAKSNLLENIASTVDKILINTDITIGIYLNLVDKEIDRLQFSRYLNNNLAAKEMDEVVKWTSKEIDDIYNQNKVDFSSKSSTRQFYRKIFGKNWGKEATKVEKELIKSRQQIIRENSTLLERVLSSKKSRKKIINAANDIRKAAAENAEKIRKTQRLTLQNISDKYSKLNQDANKQILTLRSDRIHSAFSNSKLWPTILTAISAVNLCFATKRVVKDQDGLAALNILGAALEISSIVAVAYRKHYKTVPGRGELMVLKVVFRAQTLSAFKISLAARLGYISGVIGGIVSILDGVNQIERKNEAAGAAFIASGVLALGATAAFWGAYVGLIGASAMGGPLIILSILVALVGIAISKTEFEIYLAHTVYYNKRISELENKNPAEALQYIYNSAAAETRIFKDDDGQKYDLQNFHEMLSYLYNKIYVVELNFHSYHNYKVAYESIIFCPKFDIECKLPVLQPSTRLEYVMIIQKKDMQVFYTNLKNHNYNALDEKISYILHPTNVSPIKPIEEQGKTTGSLVRFTFDLSSIMQDYENMKFDDEFNLKPAFGNSDYRKRRLTEKKYETEFTFAIRFLFNDIGIESWPVAIDNDPQYFLYKGILYNRSGYNRQKFDPLTSTEYGFASELQIDPQKDILDEISAEDEELNNELQILLDE